jgi:hypothetical protein
MAAARSRDRPSIAIVPPRDASQAHLIPYRNQIRQHHSGSDAKLVRAAPRNPTQFSRRGKVAPSTQATDATPDAGIAAVAMALGHAIFKPRSNLAAGGDRTAWNFR